MPLATERQEEPCKQEILGNFLIQEKLCPLSLHVEREECIPDRTQEVSAGMNLCTKADRGRACLRRRAW